MSENTTSPIIARLAEYVEYAVHSRGVERESRIAETKQKLGKLFGKEYIEHAQYSCGGEDNAVEITIGEVSLLYSKKDMYYLATSLRWPVKINSLSDLASCVAYYQPTYAQKLLDIRKGI